jgi:hypothetical protein
MRARRRPLTRKTTAKSPPFTRWTFIARAAPKKSRESFAIAKVQPNYSIIVNILICCLLLS